MQRKRRSTEKYDGRRTVLDVLSVRRPESDVSLFEDDSPFARELDPDSDPAFWEQFYLAYVDAIVSFPFGMSEYLSLAKHAGLAFSEAWTSAFDRSAIERGFTWKGRRGHVEPALPFAKRHFAAAYDGITPRAYCVVTTCVDFAADEYGLCDEHATYRANEAAAA